MTKSGLFYFGPVRRSDWLPRTIEEGQQVERSMDSDSEDSRDADMEANYSGSESDEDEPLDGDLGRPCRGAGLVDVGIDAGSDSDEELGGLGAISGQQSLAPYDGMGALQALITPENAAPMD